MKKLPFSVLLLAPLGILTLLTGGLAMAGTLKAVHPMLNLDGGLALVVSGIALLLTAGFPLVIGRLTEQDAGK